MKYLFFLLLIIIAGYRFLIFFGGSTDHQFAAKSKILRKESSNEIKGSSQSIATVSPDADSSLIAQIQSEEFQDGLEQIQENQGAFNDEEEPVNEDVQFLIENMNSSSSPEEFNNWLLDNIPALQDHSEVIIERLFNNYYDEPKDQNTYEKYTLLLKNLSSTAETFNTERELYVAIARDSSAEAGPLVLQAFANLTENNSIDEEQKFQESLFFIKQRNDPAEQEALKKIYIEKNPAFADRMNAEIN